MLERERTKKLENATKVEVKGAGVCLAERGRWLVCSHLTHEDWVDG